MSDDLGPLPRVHERHEAVERAKTELMGLVMDWSRKHSLTLAEELALLTEQMNRTLWAAVERERKAT